MYNKFKCKSLYTYYHLIYLSFSAYNYPQPPPRPAMYNPYMRMDQGALTSDPSMKQESKPIVPAAPTLQELEAERSARRARRNRTCFTRQQVNIHLK